MSILILTEGNLTPFCSRTQITYTFDMVKQSRRLNIDFSYQPKTLEDREKSRELITNCLMEFAPEDGEKMAENWEKYRPVCNLLTISADDSMGFRGCAHRHPQKQHLFIGDDSASPGFIPGEITRGLWKVTVSVHAIVTENCHYKLCVWEGDRKDDEMDTL